MELALRLAQLILSKMSRESINNEYPLELSKMVSPRCYMIPNQIPLFIWKINEKEEEKEKVSLKDCFYLTLFITEFFILVLFLYLFYLTFTYSISV